MNNKGMATIESIALITVFSVLFAYTIGMFVVIHTGIVNSIAARTYAWETFSHRTNLMYFRDNRGNVEAACEHTKTIGYRAHSITSEHSSRNIARPFFYATERYIATQEPDEVVGRNKQAHAQLTAFAKREQGAGVNPVWIRTAYGICLNATCGGD